MVAIATITPSIKE
jgi:hypothetical protein